MGEDKDRKPPEEGEERTVFAPGAGPPIPDRPGEPGPPPDAGPPPAPAAAPEAGPPPGPAPAEGAPPRSEPSTARPAATAFAPRASAEAIRVGDVLNHIFEVKRFIARGGMGEVFEGCNVNTDERVAIKVMLPALAADARVVEMFRKEARTLTKLHHEAIVPYRVLAQEPQLGVLYIVTDYVEGQNLAEILGRVAFSPDDLAGLLRRLAGGLGHAHRLGAVHRDMAPDNVILPDGDIHMAKIIDFGIAKDLDASSATIVGDGFAGKLNYVAPEQLGDFGREIGPWTDVYSLALVVLAVAKGGPVDMSGSLVDAIDKRRKGPDLSPVPPRLRPLLEAMLRPDPKDRLRSMDEVVAGLGGAGLGAAAAGTGAGAMAGPRRGPRKGLLVGAVLAAALAAAAGAWFLLGDLDLDFGRFGARDSEVSGSIGAPLAPGGDPAAAARAAIDSVLPSVSCTWLDISGVEAEAGAVTVALRGVAGDSGAAQQEIGRALAGAGIGNARLDLGDVAPILPAGCAALDTYRQVRASSGHRLSLPQPRFEMVRQPAGLPYAGGLAANAVVDFDAGNAGADFAIIGIEPSGAITALLPSRADFGAALAQSVDGRPIADRGNGRYRLSIDLDHQGWSGIILVTGQGPFVPDLIAPPVGSRGPTWQRQFLDAAALGRWRAEMVWFESVNRDPNDGPAAMPAAAAGDKP